MSVTEKTTSADPAVTPVTTKVEAVPDAVALPVTVHEKVEYVPEPPVMTGVTVAVPPTQTFVAGTVTVIGGLTFVTNCVLKVQPALSIMV